MIIRIPGHIINLQQCADIEIEVSKRDNYGNVTLRKRVFCLTNGKRIEHTAHTRDEEDRIASLIDLWEQGTNVFFQPKPATTYSDHLGKMINNIEFK